MTSKKLRRLIITVTILIFVFWRAGRQRIKFQKTISSRFFFFSKVSRLSLLLETLSSLNVLLEKEKLQNEEELIMRH